MNDFKLPEFIKRLDKKCNVCGDNLLEITEDWKITEYCGRCMVTTSMYEEQETIKKRLERLEKYKQELSDG